MDEWPSTWQIPGKLKPKPAAGKDKKQPDCASENWK